jgi:hypothetical protein
MKHKIKLLITLLFLIGSQPVFSQLTFKDYFNAETPLTYLGVDFTQAKVNGHIDYDLGEMVKWHFANINNLVLNEPKKYDLPKFFHKSEVLTDISFVEAHNKKIDADKLKSSGEDKELTTASLEKLVKGYSFGNKKGMGVMLVVESMDKIKEQGILHIVFVDMNNSKLLFSEKFITKPAGFGVRNYWAKIIYNVMDKIGDSKYKDWKKSNS